MLIALCIKGKQWTAKNFLPWFKKLKYEDADEKNFLLYTELSEKNDQKSLSLGDLDS